MGKVAKQLIAKAGIDFILHHNFAPVRDFMEPRPSDTIWTTTKWMDEGLYVIFYLEAKRMAVLYDLGKDPEKHHFVPGNYGYARWDSDGSWHPGYTNSVGQGFNSNGGVWTLGQIDHVMRLGRKQRKSMTLVCEGDNKAINAKTGEDIDLGYDADEGRELVRELFKNLQVTFKISRNQESRSRVAGTFCKEGPSEILWFRRTPTAGFYRKFLERDETSIQGKYSRRGIL